MFISGGDSFIVPPLGDPLMLPSERNLDDFQVPPNVVIDNSSSLVYEFHQVDKVIFNNQDVRGDYVSIGDFDSSSFNGMNMAKNVFVLSDGPFSGIKYTDIEIITFNLGDGVDSITVSLVLPRRFTF